MLNNVKKGDGMKLQDYKNGAIYKINGKLVYRTESGKTEREYDTIQQLIEGENGKQSKKPTAEEKAEVVEVVEEES